MFCKMALVTNKVAVHLQSIDEIEIIRVLCKDEYLRNVCQEVLDCLSETDCESWNLLDNKVKEFEASEDTKKQIQEKYENVKLTKRELVQQYERDSTNNYAELNLITEKVGLLRDELENEKTEYELKLRYLIKWQNSQNEQRRLKLRMLKQQLEKQIRHNNENVEHEKLVHERILKYYNMLIVENNQAADMWREKYRVDTEDIRAKIKELTIKNDSNNNNIKILRELNERRSSEMQAYEDYKEQKRLEAELFAKRHKNATTIQAWWRGTMVRRKLGPYRPKKSAKSGKGKGSGGKHAKPKSKK